MTAQHMARAALILIMFVYLVIITSPAWYPWMIERIQKKLDKEDNEKQK